MNQEIAVVSKPEQVSFKREHPRATAMIVSTVTTLSLAAIGAGLTWIDQQQKAQQPSSDNGLRIGIGPEWTAAFGARRALITSETRNLQIPEVIEDVFALLRERNCFDVRITATNSGEIRANILKSPINEHCS